MCPARFLCSPPFEQTLLLQHPQCHKTDAHHRVAVVALVTHVVSRYVLDRPQPVRSPDVAAADDAVRSRSLHALGGTAIGIEIWLVSLAVGGTVISAIARYGPGPATEGRQEAFPLFAGTSFLVLVVFVVVLPVVGFVVGRRLTRRPFRVPAPLDITG